MADISAELKQIYSEQAARRRATGMSRGQLRLTMEAMAIDAFCELWDSWVVVLGKEKATDNLIEGMIRQHEIIRARLGYRGEANYPVAWIKTSAPRLRDDDDREPEGQEGNEEVEEVGRS
jgi:hypothetical protein